MARAKRKSEPDGAEPASTADAIRFHRDRLLRSWRAGQIPVVQRRMRELLALCQAVPIWRNENGEEGKVEYAE